MAATPQNASLQTQPPSAGAAVTMVGYGTTAQRPGNPPNGFLYYDTTLQAEYTWNGTSWQPVSTPIPPSISMVGFGTTAQRPTSPANGFLYYDTTLQAEYVFNNGSGWQPVAPAASVSYPTHYTLVTANSGAATRSVYLTAGTWQLSIQTMGYDNDTGGNSNITVSQNGAIISVAVVTSKFTALRTGGSGFGRNVGMGGIAVSNVVVPSSGIYTMSMDAVQTSGTTVGNWVPTGSILMCEKLS